MTSKTLPLLKEVLELDAYNSNLSYESLRAFDPVLTETLDHVATAWSKLGNIFAAETHLTDSFENIGLAQEKLKSFSVDLLGIIEDVELLDFGIPANDKSVDVIKKEFSRIRSTLPRHWLLLRMNRDYLFGITDQLRGRISSSFSYLRLQLETAAILYLSNRNAQVTIDWWDTTGEGGKRFHKKYSQQISEFIKIELGLKDEFDLASNIAHHPRIGGIAKGIEMGQRTEGEGVFKTTGLKYQEYDDPADLLLYLGRFVRSQARLLTRYNVFLPELSENRPASRVVYDLAKIEAVFNSRIESILKDPRLENERAKRSKRKD